MDFETRCSFNIPQKLFAQLFETAVKTDADNVGGLVDTLPGNNSFQAKIVQALTTHKFGVGNSGFRVGMEEGEADTVPFGFFKKEIFNKIGLLKKSSFVAKIMNLIAE